jgi:hypothetical protein
MMPTHYEKTGHIYVPNTTTRRGNKMDAYSVPNGAMVSVEASKGFSKEIRDNSVLREKLEKAQRMTGKTLLHMAMLRKNDADDKDLLKNTEFAENIMKKRLVEESDDLQGSKKGYEKINSAN